MRVDVNRGLCLRSPNTFPSLHTNPRVLLEPGSAEDSPDVPSAPAAQLTWLLLRLNVRGEESERLL